MNVWKLMMVTLERHHNAASVQSASLMKSARSTCNNVFKTDRKQLTNDSKIGMFSRPTTAGMTSLAHSGAFGAIAIITQLSINNGEKLFPAHSDDNPPWHEEEDDGDCDPKEHNEDDGNDTLSDGMWFNKHGSLNWRKLLLSVILVQLLLSSAAS